MHLLEAILLGVAAGFWVVYGGYCLLRIHALPRVRRYAPAPREGEFVSVLVAARDEERPLPEAMASLLAQRQVHYEVIAVDDRSSDATGAILDDFAARDERLRVCHVRELPPGWMGKPYALETGYESARGDWLLFTDADVRFHPETLGRALALAREQNLDHLTLIASLDMSGFWEHAALSYIALAFLLGIRPWLVDKPSAGSYMGIGAFQLVRREAYEAAGGHRRLAMEVVDDMKLGKMVKRAGFRSAVGIADEFVRIRWQEGLGNVIAGLTKNMFAGMSFRIWKAVGTFFAVMILSVVPFAALGFAHGWALGLAIAAAAGAIGFNIAVLRGSGAEAPLYGFAHPVGALLFSWIAIRSMTVTLRQGGIVWRGTFYPLDELRRGSV